MEQVKPSHLHTAARVSDALVYAAGLAGVIAGGLLLRSGDTGFAVVAWALTFVAGASLRLASWAAKALAELLVRTERIEERLTGVRADQTGAESRRPDEPPDPYRRWGGWH